MLIHLLMMMMMMMSTSLQDSDDDDAFIDPGAFIEPDDPDYY